MSAPSPRSPSDHRRDPIGLLEAQLLRTTHHGLPVRERAQQRHQRQLVDRQRHLLGLDHGALERAGGHVELPERLAVRLGTGLLEIAEDHRAHALGDAEEARPRPVEAHVLDDHARSRHERRRRDDERRRRGVARHRDLVQLQLVDLGDGRAQAGVLEGHPSPAHQALGVIAALGALDDRGRALGEHPGDQDARLDLRARHGQLVGDPDQLRPAHRERREAPVARLDPGTHGGQRLADPVHRPAADRLVAVERPGTARLPGEPARQQAHQRARVADVEQPAGRLERRVQPDASDQAPCPGRPPPRRRRASAGRRAWSGCPGTRGSCAR